MSNINGELGRLSPKGQRYGNISIVEVLAENSVKLKVKPEKPRPEVNKMFHEVFDVLDEDQLLGALMAYLQNVTYDCRNDLLMGAAPPKDGGWNICTDVGIKANSCLVYSVGISGSLSFADSMAEYGCNVYSFDPSKGLTDHQRSERHWFYNIGLWYRNDDARQYNKIGPRDTRILQIWKCLTLDSIMEMLHHEHETLDVLKIDIEGQEYKVFPQILESGVLKKVKQLNFEIHLSPDTPKLRLWNTYTNIKRLMKYYGFELWAIHPNEKVKKKDFGVYAGMHPCCYELSWINTNFLPVEADFDTDF
ncbi:putative methyltransferase-like protein 24 [Glandiceps talaboti]